MRKIKIILADPPLKGPTFTFYHPTLGILYLISALRRMVNNNLFEVIYLEGDHSLESHLQEVKRIQPDIYGISMRTYTSQIAYKTLNEVHKILPNTTLFSGGDHPTIMPEEVFDNSPVDYLLRGESEYSFPFFIQQFIDQSDKLYQTPGLVYRKNNKITKVEVKPMEPNIDKFGEPAWDVVDVTKYEGLPYRKTKPYLGVLVSRGCPFSCTFCSEPIWKINNKPSFRSRTIQPIINEIDYLYKRGIRELRLWCEELNADINWTKELMRGIISLNKKDLYLNFNIRADKVDEELARLMKDAGTWMISMGIESSSNRTLHGVRKQVTIEQITYACKLLSSQGIRIQGYFQFFSAWEEEGRLKFETFSEAIKTIRWALKQARNKDLHYMFTSFSTPRPGTELWRVAKKNHLCKSKTINYYDHKSIGMNLPGIKSHHFYIVALYSVIAKFYIALRNGNINGEIFWNAFKRNISQFTKVRVTN